MQPCVELTQLLSAYVDGETCPAQTELIDAHLGHCGRCSAIVTWHRETAALLQLSGDDEWVPPDLRLRVARAYSGRGAGTTHLSMFAGVAISIALVGGLLHGISPQAVVHIAAREVSATSVPVSDQDWKGGCNCVRASRPAANDRYNPSLKSSRSSASFTRTVLATSAPPDGPTVKLPAPAVTGWVPRPARYATVSARRHGMRKSMISVL